MSYRQQLEAVRQQYEHRCGYCGVAESDVGALLEIDHYGPPQAGGIDAPSSLVYCCPTCNRHKVERLATHLLNQLLDEDERTQLTKERTVEILAQILGLLSQVGE